MSTGVSFDLSVYHIMRCVFRLKRGMVIYYNLGKEK
nr:MAG TPA: hypothetical protein [Caudoviricetes sp.]